MRNSRILPLLGPAAALYLAADATAAASGLPAMAWLVALIGLGLTLTPYAVRGLVASEIPGSRRVGTLGVGLGVALVASLGPTQVSMTRDLVFAITLPLASAAIVDLALDVPDRTPLRWMRMPVIVLAVVAGAVGMSATLPAMEIFGTIVLAPPHLIAIPLYFALGALVFAGGLRFMRGPWGSTPTSRASSAWGVLGLIPATVLGLLAWIGSLQVGLDARSTWLRLAAGVCAAVLVYGHTALVDPSKRLRAGSATREAVAALLPLGVGVALMARFGPELLADRWSAAALALVGLVTIAGLWWWGRPRVRRVLAPYGGRLLDAVAEARRDMGRASDLDTLGASVLGPLRHGTGDEASPRILTFAPARDVRVDAAGNARVTAAQVPEALEMHLVEHPGSVIVTDLLAAHIVRRPALRPVVEQLEAWGAICVVPLGVLGEIEGVLVVPRGSRRSPLSLEEIADLRALGEEVGARVGLLGGRDRALQHVAELATRFDALEERCSAAEEEAERLRGDAAELRAGRGRARQEGSAVAYSAAMKALDERLAEVAAQEQCVTLVAEAGLPVDRYASRAHELSARADGPFVVADASSARDSERALLGDEDHPGWLRLGAGGTLLLADVPALSAQAQHALAEALALRQARPVDTIAAYPLDVRVIATTRTPLDELVQAGTFDAELARWLSALVIEVPPLRDRLDDLPSLVMLALDRARRVLGKEPVGIAQGAMDELLAHDWPGNLRELQHVIDRAVARAKGDQVQRADLPAFPSSEPHKDPLEGTFAALEHRILERAMLRANGNKSEAARLLGLKRTTFLDKLRRQSVAPPPPPPAEDETRA